MDNDTESQVGVTGIIQAMGVTIEQDTEEVILVKMPLTSNLNTDGTVYTAALLALVEYPATIAMERMLDHTQVNTQLVELNFRFRHQPTSDLMVEFEVQPEDFINLQNEALSAGKSMMIMEQQVLDLRREIVAVVETRMVCEPVPRSAQESPDEEGTDHAGSGSSDVVS